MVSCKDLSSSICYDVEYGLRMDLKRLDIRTSRYKSRFHHPQREKPDRTAQNLATTV